MGCVHLPTPLPQCSGCLVMAVWRVSKPCTACSSTQDRRTPYTCQLATPRCTQQALAPSSQPSEANEPQHYTWPHTASGMSAGLIHARREHDAGPTMYTYSRCGTISLPPPAATIAPRLTAERNLGTLPLVLISQCTATFCPVLSCHVQYCHVPRHPFVQRHLPIAAAADTNLHQRQHVIARKDLPWPQHLNRFKAAGDAVIGIVPGLHEKFCDQFHEVFTGQGAPLSKPAGGIRSKRNTPQPSGVGQSAAKGPNGARREPQQTCSSTRSRCSTAQWACYCTKSS